MPPKDGSHVENVGPDNLTRYPLLSFFFFWMVYRLLKICKIAYEIQLRYVIRDKIQSKKKISNCREKILRLNFVLDCILSQGEFVWISSALL